MHCWQYRRFSGSVSRFILLTLVCLPLLAIPRPAQAATLVVNSSADTTPGSCMPTCTLRSAIALAAPGDGITFNLPNPSTITLTSALTIAKNLTISGPGANVLAVDGNNANRVFAVNSGTVSISGLTIRNGKSSGFAGVGGGINVASGATLTVSSSTLTGNSATRGGGSISNSGTLTVSNSTISGNSTPGGFGGGINNLAMLTVSNSTISGNSTPGGIGGGINNGIGGTLTISNSTLSGNSTPDGWGGGINNDPGGRLTVSNSTLSGNSAPGGSGGGISNGNILNLSSSIVAGNTASLIGPDIKGAVVSLGSNLIGNTSGASGFVSSDQQNVNPLLNPLQLNSPGTTQTQSLQSGSPAISKGNCSGNNKVTPIAPAVSVDQRGVPRKVPCDVGAYETPLVVNSSADTISGSCVTTCTLRDAIALAAPGGGITFNLSAGSIITLSSTLTIGKNLTISGPGANVLAVDGNNANRVFTVNSGTVNISGLTIRNGNSAPDVAAGGIYNAGTLTVSNSTLSGNSATGSSFSTGGGIANAGTLTVSNSTLSGNSSTGGGAGGIFNFSMLTVSNSTLSGNSSRSVGGGIANLATLNLGSNIVAGNTDNGTGPDIFNLGVLKSLGNNLIGNTHGASGYVSSDQQNVNPMLNSLNLNSPGTTPTQSLQSGSPAIGKGSCTGNNTVKPIDPAVSADQRRVARKSPCDVGAYETP